MKLKKLWVFLFKDLRFFSQNLDFWKWTNVDKINSFKYEIKNWVFYLNKCTSLYANSELFSVLYSWSSILFFSKFHRSLIQDEKRFTIVTTILDKRHLTEAASRPLTKMQVLSHLYTETETFSNYIKLVYVGEIYLKMFCTIKVVVSQSFTWILASSPFFQAA